MSERCVRIKTLSSSFNAAQLVEISTGLAKSPIIADTVSVEVPITLVPPFRRSACLHAHKKIV